MWNTNRIWCLQSSLPARDRVMMLLFAINKIIVHSMSKCVIRSPQEVYCSRKQYTRGTLSQLIYVFEDRRRSSIQNLLGNNMIWWYEISRNSKKPLHLLNGNKGSLKFLCSSFEHTLWSPWSCTSSFQTFSSPSCSTLPYAPILAIHIAHILPSPLHSGAILILPVFLKQRQL